MDDDITMEQLVDNIDFLKEMLDDSFYNIDPSTNLTTNSLLKQMETIVLPFLNKSIQSLENENFEFDLNYDTVFYRTVNKVMPNQIDLQSKEGHYMNATPLGNLNIKLKFVNDSISFIALKHNVKLVNLIKIQHYFNTQFKQGKGYAQRVRGLFDFMNETTIARFCKKYGYDGVITMDNIDAVKRNDNIFNDNTSFNNTDTEILKINNNGKPELTDNYQYLCKTLFKQNSQELFLTSERQNNNNKYYYCFPEFFILKDNLRYLENWEIQNYFSNVVGLSNNLLTVSDHDNYKRQLLNDDIGDVQKRSMNTNRIEQLYPNFCVLPIEYINKIIIPSLENSFLRNEINLFNFYNYVNNNNFQQSWTEFGDYIDKKFNEIGSDKHSYIKTTIFPIYQYQSNFYNNVYDKIKKKQIDNDCDFMNLKTIATKEAYNIGYPEISNDGIISDPSINILQDRTSPTPIKSNISFLFPKIVEMSLRIFQNIYDINNNTINDYQYSLLFCILNILFYNCTYTNGEINKYKTREFVKNLLGYTKKIEEYYDNDVIIQEINNETYKVMELIKSVEREMNNSYDIFLDFLDDKIFFDFNNNSNYNIGLFKDKIKNIFINNPNNSYDIKELFDMFFRFYLKGGSTLVFLGLNLSKLLEEDRRKYFGDLSDFDYNTIINAFIPEEDYNLMYKTLEIAFNNIIRDKILDVYKDDNSFIQDNTNYFIERLKDKLNNNNIVINTSQLTDRYIVYDTENDIIGKDIINRDNNNISFLYYQYKDKYNFLDTNTQFGLFRLMLQFPTVSINNDKCMTSTAVELIDISIIKYGSNERINTWNHAKKHLTSRRIKDNINNVESNFYIYDIDYAIEDLKTVIKENKEKGITKKLEKREKRLKTLYDFKCLYLANSEKECKKVFDNLSIKLNIDDKFIIQFINEFLSDKSYNFYYSETNKIISFIFMIVANIFGITIPPDIIKKNGIETIQNQGNDEWYQLYINSVNILIEFLNLIIRDIENDYKKKLYILIKIFEVFLKIKYYNEYNSKTLQQYLIYKVINVMFPTYGDDDIDMNLTHFIENSNIIPSKFQYLLVDLLQTYRLNAIRMKPLNEIISNIINENNIEIMYTTENSFDLLELLSKDINLFTFSKNNFYLKNNLFTFKTKKQYERRLLQFIDRYFNENFEINYENNVIYYKQYISINNNQYFILVPYIKFIFVDNDNYFQENGNNITSLVNKYDNTNIEENFKNMFEVIQLETTALPQQGRLKKRRLQQGGNNNLLDNFYIEDNEDLNNEEYVNMNGNENNNQAGGNIVHKTKHNKTKTKKQSKKHRKTKTQKRRTIRKQKKKGKKQTIRRRK